VMQLYIESWNKSDRYRIRWLGPNSDQERLQSNLFEMVHSASEEFRHGQESTTQVISRFADSVSQHPRQGVTLSFPTSNRRNTICWITREGSPYLADTSGEILLFWKSNNSLNTSFFKTQTFSLLPPHEAQNSKSFSMNKTKGIMAICLQVLQVLQLPQAPFWGASERFS
jgi:hypothetical protein